GSLIPIIPGTLIAWAGIFIYKLWVPADLSWQFVGITAGLTTVAQLLDFLASYYGTKKFGGSTQGAFGAILGGLIGPFLLTPLVGIFLGPMIGAIIGELLAKRTVYASGKSGLGTFLGGLASFVIKIALTVTMIVWFYWEVF
ncbi:MAG: DUF456 domain-containing protein, partial [Verrucomicrobiota bacterium]